MAVPIISNSNHISKRLIINSRIRLIINSSRCSRPRPWTKCLLISISLSCNNSSHLWIRCIVSSFLSFNIHHLWIPWIQCSWMKKREGRSVPESSSPTSTCSTKMTTPASNGDSACSKEAKHMHWLLLSTVDTWATKLESSRSMLWWRDKDWLQCRWCHLCCLGIHCILWSRSLISWELSIWVIWVMTNWLISRQRENMGGRIMGKLGYEI